MSSGLINALFNGFTLSIVLVTQILITSTSRKNILLGVKIPEEKIKTDSAKAIIKGFKKENILVGVPSLIILSILVYYIDNVNVIMFSTFAYIGLLFLVYLRWNKRAKRLKIEEGWGELSSKILVVDTDFSRDRGKTYTVSKKLYFIPLAMVLINAILALKMYPYLPGSIPTHWDLKGNVDGYMNKSMLVVMLMPIMQLIMVLVFYLSNLFMLNSKQQINSNNPEGSLKKNIIFRKVWSIYFLVVLILMEILFTALNLASLGLLSNVGAINIFTFIVTGAIVISSLLLAIKLGQGGDRLKINDEDSLSEYDIDDDHLWKLGGAIYYNPNDSSIFIEKRVGIGWTVNAGRPVGMLLTIRPFIIIVLTLYFVN